MFFLNFPHPVVLVVSCDRPALLHQKFASAVALSILSCFPMPSHVIDNVIPPIPSVKKERYIKPFKRKRRVQQGQKEICIR